MSTGYSCDLAAARRRRGGFFLLLDLGPGAAACEMGIEINTGYSLNFCGLFPVAQVPSGPSSQVAQVPSGPSSQWPKFLVAQVPSGPSSRWPKFPVAQVPSGPKCRGPSSQGRFILNVQQKTAYEGDVKTDTE